MAQGWEVVSLEHCLDYARAEVEEVEEDRQTPGPLGRLGYVNCTRQKEEIFPFSSDLSK